MRGILAGRQLGEFALLEPLGEGASSLVYLADQATLQRKVVIKLARTDGSQAASRFLAEARLASRVEHPYIAHTYGYGVESDGLCWIAMERARGVTLATLIEDQPLALEQIVPCLRRLCEVVQAAHDMGIVHRDIKPENVMIEIRGGAFYPKLLDLGVALDGSQREATDGRLGTPAYMAPECWVNSGNASPASDIYALGILAFEMIAGALPFRASSIRQLAMHHARTPLPALPDRIPAGIRVAIEKATAKRAADRFESALAFADALAATAEISMDAVGLPKLDEITKTLAVTTLPSSVAMAVARLDAAPSGAKTLRAAQNLLGTTAQLVGLVGLACADRLGIGRNTPNPIVRDLLSTLQAQGLGPRDWWRLAREVARPFATTADLFPIPEIVTLFFDGPAEVRRAMDEWLDASLKAPDAIATADTIRNYLLGLMPAIDATLRSLHWLSHYTVAALSDRGQTIAFVGASPVAIELAPADPIAGVAVLTREGATVARLDDYVVVAAPAPGEPTQLFWFDGCGRSSQSASYRAVPDAYTHERSVPWFGADHALSATDEEAPYKGLLTFSEEDASSYFGREQEIDVFVNRLRKTPWIVVAGPSGVGKSSFVRAGVIPALKPAHRLVLRPGPAPIARLQAALAASGVGLATPTDHEALRSALLSLSARSASGQILLVVDQFEELFTQAPAAEQETFAALLANGARLDDPIRIVLTIRDDFLVKAAGLASLRQLISSQVQLLATPGRNDLMRILVEPARRAGFEFEDPELPASMVNEVSSLPGALAMLSFASTKLWTLRDREARHLTRAAYRSLGGVGGALAQHAETMLDAMPPHDQTIVRELFRHLVTAEGTRASMSRAELLQIVGSNAAPVLEQLINSRLLVSSEDERVEVVHETLLIAWPRLVRWRAQDAEHVRLRDQLRSAARQWRDRGCDKGLLWRGDALTEYTLWRTRYAGRLTDLEEEFGRASQRLSQRIRRLKGVALGATLTSLTIALVVFSQLQRSAKASEKVALAARGRAETSETRMHATLLAALIETGRLALLRADYKAAFDALSRAIADGDTQRSVGFMRNMAEAQMGGTSLTARHDGAVTAVDFINGQIITAGSDGWLRVQDGNGAKPAQAWRVYPPGCESSVAVAHAQQLLAVACDKNDTVKLVALQEDTVTDLIAPNRGVVSLAFIGDDLLIGDLSGQGHRCNLAARRCDPIGAQDANVWTSVSAAPDASQFAVGYLGADLSSGKLYQGGQRVAPRAVAVPGDVRALQYSPDSRWLAAATSEGKLHLWSASANAEYTLSTNSFEPLQIAFTPDSRTLAIAFADHTIQVWGTTKRRMHRLTGHKAQVTRVVFLNNQFLASAAGNGEVFIWDWATGIQLTALAVDGMINGLAFDTGTQLLAAGTARGSVAVWPITGQVLPSLHRSYAWIPTIDTAAVNGRHIVRRTPAGVEVLDVLASRTHLLGQAGSDFVLLPETLVLVDGKALSFHKLNQLTEAPTASWSVPSAVLAAAAAPTGNQIVLHRQGRVEVRDVNGTPLREVPWTKPVDELRWYDHAIMCLSANEIHVLNPATLAVHHTIPLSFLRASADETGWATQSARNGLEIATTLEARVNVQTGMPIMSTLVAKGRVYAGTRDGSLYIWGVDGALIANVKAHLRSILDIGEWGDFITTVGRDGWFRIFTRDGTLIFERAISVQTPFGRVVANHLVFHTNSHWQVTPLPPSVWLP